MRGTLVASGKDPDKIDKVRVIKVKRANQHNKRQEIRWWDDECAKVIRAKGNKLKIWRRTGRMENFVQYKKCRAISGKTINKKKKEDFRRFCNGINRFKSLSYVWNYENFKKRQK